MEEAPALSERITIYAPHRLTSLPRPLHPYFSDSDLAATLASQVERVLEAGAKVLCFGQEATVTSEPQVLMFGSASAHL